MSSKHVDEARRARWSKQDYDFDDRLEGREILVAGGSGGLGAAVCARLLDAGARVVISFRSDADRARAVRDGLCAGRDAEVRLLQGNIATDAGREAVVAGLDHERLYGAVVCVGDPARVAPADMGIAALEQALHDNYTGPILLARSCAEILASTGVAGSLVLVSSMQGVAPFPGSLAYSGPKSALVHVAKILAQEYGGGANVRVNVVAPGVTEAGMALASIDSGKYDRFIDDGVVPRFGRPEDIARCIGFLMTPDNYVTGQTIVVDGGLTLRRGTT